MHNRKLTRLSGFDYSENRNYFFTICIQNHEKTFGSIANKSMLLLTLNIRIHKKIIKTIAFINNNIIYLQYINNLYNMIPTDLIKGSLKTIVLKLLTENGRM
jgi:hypothetical protein